MKKGHDAVAELTCSSLVLTCLKFFELWTADARKQSLKWNLHFECYMQRCCFLEPDEFEGWTALEWRILFDLVKGKYHPSWLSWSNELGWSSFDLNLWLPIREQVRSFHYQSLLWECGRHHCHLSSQDYARICVQKVKELCLGWMLHFWVEFFALQLALLCDCCWLEPSLQSFLMILAVRFRFWWYWQLQNYLRKPQAAIGSYSL